MTRGGIAFYAPGSVGCCTIGLGGLVGSVLVVVVDAAPSSRVKAIIHAIMGVPSCLALLFPPQAGAWAQKNMSAGCAVRLVRIWQNDRRAGFTQ
jgi:hypothetical protein